MSEIKLTADGGGGSVSLKGPATTTGNAGVNLKLPVADGSTNQVLKTDGSGQLSFTTITDTDTVYDDTNLRKDLATLALQTAVDTNRKAYNLSNSFIDQFEDDTGIGTETNVDRSTTDECISSEIKTAIPARRYWRLYKTSAAAGGGYHKETQMFTGTPGSYSQVTLAWNSSWSQNDLQAWHYDRVSDGNTGNNAFHTDSADAGAWLKIDFGSGSEKSITKWRMYISDPDSVIWNIQSSPDDSTWTTVKTGWQTDRNQANGSDTWVVDAEWVNESSSYNATGTVIGVANTASSSRTKVSGTFLYKNQAGTATIGTDLKIYFTCNGGTNWTEAASYTAGSDFSTGIKTIYLGQTTCTAGTDVRYKAVWANQAEAKVTQLHGIGVNY